MAKRTDQGTDGRKQDAAAGRRGGTLRLALAPAGGAIGRSPLAGRALFPRGAR